MGFAIICDARKGGSLGITTLALVDRSKTKRLWWTTDDSNIILNYRKKSAAEFAVSRLRRNNARIVSFNEAVSIIQDQESTIEYHDIMSGCELGWDAHKEI